MPAPELLSTLFGSLGANPYFSAGFGLLGVGTGMAALRLGFRHSYTYLRRSALISLEIPSKDKSFSWFLHWMAIKSGQKTQHLTVETNYRQFENGEITTNMQLIPSVGTHFIKFRGRWIKMERSREKTVVDFNSGNLWESITLTTVGRSPQIFHDLLEEAKELSVKNEKGHTIVYVTKGQEWIRFGFPRKRRMFSTVVLKEGQGERILNDCIEFLKSPQWYFDRGLNQEKRKMNIFSLCFFIRESHSFFLSFFLFFSSSLPSRHSLQKRISFVWSTWVRKILIYYSAGWRATLEYLCVESPQQSDHR
jgi:chaperone BCS1